MNANRLSNLNIVRKALRTTGFTLAIGALIVILCLGLVQAATLPASPDSTGQQTTPPSSQFGYKFTKGGGVKIKAVTSTGKVVQKKFHHFQDYTVYDSVFLLQGIKKCYTYSLKTGILSEPYLDMGSFENQPGNHLLACLDNNKKIGFINYHTGKEVIPCQFYFNEDVYYEDYPFRYCSPYFKDNKCNLQISHEHDGIIDTTGKVLIKSRNIYETDHYDGFIVEDNEGFNLYSKDLNCVLANKEHISSLPVGIIYKDSSSNNTMLIRPDSAQAIPVYILFDVTECESAAEPLNSPERESSDVYYTFDISYELGVGVVDQNMNLIVDPEWMWDKVETFGVGYFICYSEGVGFLLDKNGNFVIPETRNSSPTKH